MTMNDPNKGAIRSGHDRGFVHTRDLLGVPPEEPMDFGEQSVDVGDEVTMYIRAVKPISYQAHRCIGIAQSALEMFLEKNRGYGTTSEHLGAKGQYADMHRKMGKLKHTLWDGNPAVGESEEEMLMDLIGHCLLTIDFLRDEV